MRMDTKMWKMNEGDGNQLAEAATLLKNGEVVAFPTETVYGLGADATSNQAVKRIFDAKGRPSDNPLIVHVAQPEQVHTLVTEIPAHAEKLMKAFWPGPLTLILPSNREAADHVTAGLPTVGIRMPDHPVALQLIKEVGKPLAAPSANRSGRPSPTSAAHVYQDLNGRIAGIVDGGATGVGLESTVLDCTSDVPVILRPGGITKEQLEEILPLVKAGAALNQQQNKPMAPGMKYTHYAPEAPLWVVKGDDAFFAEKLAEKKAEGQRVGVIASRELTAHLQHDWIVSCGSRANLEEVAVHLYDALREFKKTNIDLILAESFDDKGIGAAIMNRLNKAAEKVIHQA